jgi:phosphotransferase system enzyme I (PtsI)
MIKKGFPICSGVAIATPFFFCVVEDCIPEFSIPDDKIEAEVARYYQALKNARRDLLALQKRLKAEGGGEAVAILHAHLEIMRDPVMTIDVEKEIRKKCKNTEYAFKSVIGEYEKKFSRITDKFFHERVKDFQDISRRIIAHLQQHKLESLGVLDKKSIVFAKELSPSDTAEADTEFIEAFVTASGSETSHVAIMARAKGIPFVSKVDFSGVDFESVEQVIVDGQSGDVIFNPSQETLEHYKKERKRLNVVAKGLLKNSGYEAQTIDGYTVCLSANLESFDDMEMLHKYGCEGVGLFRSEYLFLAKDAFPTEDEQFEVYRTLVEKVNGHRAIIRTFDIGGDKLGNFYPKRLEKNPYLGCRAIRFMLKEPSAFKAQMKAILRASAFGETGMMFPMISGVAELREAKQLLAQCKRELKELGIPFNENIPTGCMIEIPSAAMTADLIIKECDFLSIGTNDLVQYSLAVDRGNPAMSYLYTPSHPCILRMIKMVVYEGLNAKKSVSVCGEIAADPRFTPLLLGLGVQELSIASSALPIIKNVVRKLSIVEATELADQALQMVTFEEIENLLENFYQKIS